MSEVPYDGDLALIYAKKTLRLCLNEGNGNCAKCRQPIMPREHYFSMPSHLFGLVHEDCYLKVLQKYRPEPGQVVRWRTYLLEWDDTSKEWGRKFIGGSDRRMDKHIAAWLDDKLHRFVARIGIYGLQGRGEGDMPDVALEAAMNNLKVEALSASAAVLTI